MSRILFSFAALSLIAIGCAQTPVATTPETPEAPETPSAPSDPASRCPAPTDSCMNEDNHAQCLEIAASCDGEILQLESCPLQFACSKD
jgi:hypothetical protein